MEDIFETGAIKITELEDLMNVRIPRNKLLLFRKYYNSELKNKILHVLNRNVDLSFKITNTYVAVTVNFVKIIDSGGCWPDICRPFSSFEFLNKEIVSCIISKETKINSKAVFDNLTDAIDYILREVQSYIYNKKYEDCYPALDELIKSATYNKILGV